MAYSLTDFAESLDITRCKIRNTSRLLFLCGGPIAADATKISSARAFFYRYLQKKEPGLAARVKLAEDVSAWFQKDDQFPDLLELENYVAHLADLTLIFVESPGSIAELGAFAASAAFKAKTLVVLNTSYGSDKSFITDGPVRRIKNTNEDLVRYWKWNPRKLTAEATKAEFKAIAKDIVEVVRVRETGATQQRIFNPEALGDTLLLVADLIRVAGAASKSDILGSLAALGCTSAASTLDRHLSILQSVAYIKKHLRSNQAFYTYQTQEQFVRYSYKKTALSKNTSRNQTAIRQSLDPLRKAVIRLSLAKDSADV